ncbi:hypothetical protein [Mesosutterella porci]|nr:hypothetical protein [Mesosutterella sp. oilRF-744-WT-GAM-9]
MRMFYYNLGGGGSPKSWLSIVISLVILAALAVLLLPVLGVFVLVLFGLGVALFIGATLMQYFAQKKVEHEIEKGEEMAERARAQDDGTPASAGARHLEIQDAVVVSEVERKTRRDAERSGEDRKQVSRIGENT